MPTNKQRRILADLEPMISEIGWVVFAVRASALDDYPDAPPFAYTIGLASKGVPELIVVGEMSTEQAQGILNNAAALLIENGELPLGTEVDRILNSYPVRFYPVDPGEVAERLTIAVARAEGRVIPALQVVLPDVDGCFPGERGLGLADQPLLFTGHLWQPMVSMIVDHLRETGRWPTFGDLDRRVFRELGGADLADLIDLTPSRFMTYDSMDVRHRRDSTLSLTHLAVVEFGGSDLIEILVRALTELAAREANAPDDLEQVAVSCDDLLDLWGVVDPDGRARTATLLHTLLSGTNAVQSTTFTDDRWTTTVSRDARRYEALSGVDDYLARKPGDALGRKAAAEAQEGNQMGSSAPLEPPPVGRLRDSIEDLATDLEGFDYPDVDDVAEWVAAYDGLLPDLATYTGRDAPSLHLPRASWDEHGNFTEVGRRRLRNALDRAHAALASIDSGPRSSGAAIGPSDGGDLERTVSKPKSVFIVHGHDPANHREAVARLIENKTDLEAVILAEQPNLGQHLLNKLMRFGTAECIAVVLMTADDEGRAKASDDPSYQERARQNVVLELGYFLAKLPAERVIVLYSSGVEMPSDFAGVCYYPLDDAWRFNLAKELHAIGVNVTFPV